MAGFDLAHAIATLRDGARRHGTVSAEFVDGHGFHELIVTADGSLALNGYAGEPALIATTLAELPEPVIRRLLAGLDESDRTGFPVAAHPDGV
ncbi:hypothetical protein [Burkholderia cenocepacia]|uniref:hypothetical protein n=1 Tax=Burkholderia cenocepacia TaxID=95486 RepID=UPI0024B636F9|nr:hypothetical protein [Burkholderia cenocepacia]MDI9688527.1 hypothetical protein [Burkholderia cenocepacia]